MFLDEILHGKKKKSHPILQECTEFLSLSEGNPLFKNLPKKYDDFHKVKVRKRKRKDAFTKTFNEAFDEIPDLRQRAIFANGLTTLITENNEQEPFYIFPINGFKFMYSEEVTNSKFDYQQAFNTILEYVGDKTVVEQLLKYTYTNKNLAEGISRGSEIIIYNVPYFYAVRSSTVTNYMVFLETME